MDSHAPKQINRQASQALMLWWIFIVINILINATIPFILGADERAWIYSPTHLFLVGLVVYGGLFLVAPLILVKGWPIVRQPAFLIPLALAVLAAGLWNVFRGIGVIIVVILAFLHWRYNLSELGIRSSGWRGDILAILLIAVLYTVPRLLRPLSGGLDFLGGLQTGLFRLLGNPATTAEYLFYFGFLATRLSKRLGPIPTAILVGLMYVAHEMTNPEYWYEGVQFAFIPIGVALACAIYLWRRSLLPIWLGDGLARFFGGLLG